MSFEPKQKPAFFLSSLPVPASLGGTHSPAGQPQAGTNTAQGDGPHRRAHTTDGRWAANRCRRPPARHTRTAHALTTGLRGRALTTAVGPTGNVFFSFLLRTHFTNRFLFF